MAILRCDAAGLTAAADALVRGAAIVLPTPSPLPYAVTARVASAVNIAKQRPPGQPVALWLVDDLAMLRPHLALDSAAVDLAAWLLVEELLTVLLPLAAPDHVPNWLHPAVRAGFALVAGPRSTPLAPLHAAVSPLYVSSGNLTDERPALTAAEADEAFHGRLLVIDGDDHRDPLRPHGSSTMLRFERAGEISVVRSGVQNAPEDPGHYLDDALRRARAALRPRGHRS